MRVAIAVVLSVSVWFAAASRGEAAVLRVPANHATIGAALNAATTGDVVLVSPGTYSEVLVWPQVDGIRLVSTGGASVTTITASGLGRTVTFGPGLTRATVLDGFTITGGNETGQLGRGYGGGILIPNASPTISNNWIIGNVCAAPQGYGGAIAVTGNGTPLITRNRIVGNKVGIGTAPCFGGGVSLLDVSAADVINNRIVGNTIDADVRAYGGGIHVKTNVSARLVGNVIEGNSIPFRFDVTGRGGGIAVENGPTTILNNTIVTNTVGADGGPSGGGVAVMAPATLLANNIIASNTANGSQAPVTGGGVACLAGPLSNDVNNLWKNVPDDYDGCAAGPNDTFTDPVFADSQRHLAASSPNIDVPGANRYADRAVAQDIDGDSRRLDGALNGTGADVDVGADEYAVVRLGHTGTPDRLVVGQSVRFTLTGPTANFLLLISPNRMAAYVPSVGYAVLNAPVILIAGGGSPVTTQAFGVPNAAALVGFELHVQALVFTGPWAVVTNALTMTFV